MATKAPAFAPIRCVMGQRGYGKSTFARQLVADAGRLIVFDTNREHDCLHVDWDGFEAYTDALDAGGWARPFRVGLYEPDYAEEFCAWAWEIAQRHADAGQGITVLMEEADMLAAPGQEPRIFKQLASQGRHVGMEIIAVTRRPAEVSRFLTANADELHIFRIQEPKDLVYLRSLIGTEAADVVQGLDRFQHVTWTPQGWKQHGAGGSNDS